MMGASDYQIGGGHYHKEYQHWDMVCDTDMPYLLAAATKYVDRWTKKNGVEDLRKAIHYIAKADEMDIRMPEQPVRDFFRKIAWIETYQEKQEYYFKSFLTQASNSSSVRDKEIMNCIFRGAYQLATKWITLTINEELNDGSEPTKGYVNQDPNYFRG